MGPAASPTSNEGSPAWSGSMVLVAYAKSLGQSPKPISLLTSLYKQAKRSAVSQPCICRSGAQPRPETLPVLRCSNLRVEIVLGPGDPDIWFVAF